MEVKKIKNRKLYVLVVMVLAFLVMPWWLFSPDAAMDWLDKKVGR